MKIKQPNCRPDAFTLIRWRAVDGDTIDALIQLPLGVSVNRRIRLKGFYAPELNGRTPEAGLAAKTKLQAYLDEATLWLRGDGMKEDRYGRIIGELMHNDRPVLPSVVLGGLQMTMEAHRADLQAAKQSPRKGTPPSLNEAVNSGVPI